MSRFISFRRISSFVVLMVIATLPVEVIAQVAPVNAMARGKKLIAANSCASCHAAPNGTTLTGGRVIGGWNAPGLDGNRRTGLGTWSARDIATYLKTGRNAFAAAAGPMAGIITNVTAKMSAADVDAIATYLKSLPATPRSGSSATPISATNKSMIEGKSIYVEACAACHTKDGTGQPGLFPALKSSPQVQASNPATLLHVVLRGAQGVGTEVSPTASAMPAFGDFLTNSQIAAALTYIRNSWGNVAAPVQASMVSSARKMVNHSAAETPK